MLDAVGLSVFAVIGASKAVYVGLGAGPAVLLGVVTAVGGGTIRDALIGQIPSVLRSELYAIPALVASAITVAAIGMGSTTSDRGGSRIGLLRHPDARRPVRPQRPAPSGYGFS